MVSLAVAVRQPVFGETPKAAPAKPVPALSVFVMPASVREGRDPFYPESARPYEAAVAANRTVEVNAFTIKGLSIQGGRSMAIINNHTFAVGDEGNVRTATGEVHIRCVEIRPGTVVIEVNGTRRDISVAAK